MSAARPNIFDPFAQADQSISQGFDGNGLGLVIVNSIVTLIGGNVSMSSHPVSLSYTVAPVYE